MRVLWSLPKAAPALLRHFAAYLELAGWDLAQTQRELAASLVAFVVVAVCAFFAVLMGCIAVLALTWDGPHRLSAILWMAAGFAFIACIALLYYSSLARTRSPFLASVRQEWRQDSVILEKILADEEAP
jgi:uncharacterized membrane protein YqjE